MMANTASRTAPAMVTSVDLLSAEEARRAAREIRHDAKQEKALMSPCRKNSRRFISTTLYLRPDQVMDLARIAADQDMPTSQFVRDAIDRAISIELGRQPAQPVFRRKLLARVTP